MGDREGRSQHYAASFCDVLLTGENLRVQMHKDASGLIKDRLHHFRTQPTCFVGRDVVDYLISVKEVPDRYTAVLTLSILHENHVIHHVNDDHQFKDENLFYRFRKDDGSYPWHSDLIFFTKAQKIYQSLTTDDSKIVSTHTDNDVEYSDSFWADELIDAFISRKDFECREDATGFLRRLVENDLLHHVRDDHHFKDEKLLYQFKADFSYHRVLLDLLLPRENGEPPCLERARRRTQKIIQRTGSPAQDIPEFIQRFRPYTTYNRSDSGYRSNSQSSASPESPDRPQSGTPARPRPPPIFPAPAGDGDKTLTEQMAALLVRKLTPEELENVNAHFIHKQLRIPSDPVGFGFVVRGDGPCFVKIVDPTGPAAKAGMKVGQYVVRLNNTPVERMHHKEVASRIAGQPYLYMTVAEPRAQ